MLAEVCMDKERESWFIDSVINVLSYTEKIAAVRIWESMKGESSGILVVSQMADKYQITRSVAVSTMRKLACAQIVYTRSLGMKGTFVKINNQSFFERLSKKLKLYA